MPSYCSPISPITLNPSVVKSLRNSSSGTRWPGVMSVAETTFRG